jgi:hypothetical protein
MINPSKKQMIAAYCVAAVLTILLILSKTVFSTDSAASKKRHSIQLQLIHEADISNIDIITIQHADSAIILTRTDNMWLIANQNDVNDKIPADTERLKSFFILLASKHTMAKAGKSTNQDNSYGLDAQNGTVMTLYKNGTPYQAMTFGALNFSQTERYFTTQELKSVYLVGSEFESFLSVSITNWADPYIVSSQLKNDVFEMGQVQSAALYDFKTNKSITLNSSNEEQKKSIQKLFDLRHGGFVQEAGALEQLQALSQTKALSVELEMGDKSKIILELFEHPAIENEYIVYTTFNSERTKKSFTYKTQISAWTYNKISEMMLNTK